MSGNPTNRELTQKTNSLTSIRAIVYALGMSDLEDLLIRRAAVSEQNELEDLQLRASLTNAGDREALLAHPDAIALPVAQIAAGGVFVAEWRGTIVGFAAVEPRADGESELDALFVDPSMRRRGIARSLVAHCTEIARTRESAFLYVVGNSHAREFYAACGVKTFRMGIPYYAKRGRFSRAGDLSAVFN